MNKIAEAIGNTVLTFAASLVCSLIALLVASKLWEWYVMPAFHVALPSMANLYGLILFMMATGVVQLKNSEVGLGNMVGASLGKSFAVWFLGWLVHIWFM